MAKLKIMIGIPGSGKSSYVVKNLVNDNTVILSSDQIRIEMFGFEDQTHNKDVFEKMQKDAIRALKDGFDVVYDATNLNKKKRENLINKVKHETAAEIDAYLFCAPINVILERNLTRSERTIPWDKLVQMIQSIDVPMYYEGFNNIYLIDGGMYYDIYDYNELIKICVGYNQDNPHHLETLDEHIKSTIESADILSKNLRLNIDKNILIQAARYHDFGKLYTKTYKETKGHSVYYGHEKVSAYMFLCHVRKQRLIDDLCRVRLSDSDYQIAALILNHMEWYRRDDMKDIKLMFKDNDLFTMLELLHQADILGKNENMEADV